MIKDYLIMAASIEFQRPAQRIIETLYRLVHPFTSGKTPEDIRRETARKFYLEDHKTRIHTIFQKLSKQSP